MICALTSVGRTRLRGAWLGLLCLAGLARALVAGQEICSHNVWARELARGLKVDQEQTAEALLSGPTIGQVFTPTSDWLERLDVITKNRTDLTPGTIRIWPWLGDVNKTVKQKPLWQDDLDLSGQDAPVLRHYFPRIRLRPGRPYFLECERMTEYFYMAGVRQDVYPGGTAITNRRVRPQWDMWFRMFTRAKPPSQSYATPRRLPKPSPVRPKPPRPRKPVTKQVYLDVVRTRTERRLADWRRQPGKRSRDAVYYGGFLLKVTGKLSWKAEIPTFITAAEKYFLQDHPKLVPTFRFVSQFAHGVKWLKEKGALSADDLATARRVLLAIGRRGWSHRERGAMNRGAFKGFGYQILTDLYPDVPEAKQWKDFAEVVWHDWADTCDTNEDSAHYNAVWLDAVLPWIRWRSQADLFRDPRMRQFVSRFRDVLTPQGAMPSWGDSLMLGADWGAFIALFEMAATLTRDPTYKWAAHRVLEHHRRYILDDHPLQCAYEDIPNLVWAYLEADDAITPAPPKFPSQVLSATQCRRLPKKVRVEERLPWYMLQKGRSPWKLVTRDGADETAWYALWGLRPWGGHGHADAPALVCLSAGGTVLTHDTSYFDKRVEDHNMLYGIRVRGGKLGREREDTRVVRFADMPGVSYADVAWHDYPGWGTAFRREILFVKGLGWWVRDRTDAQKPAEWYLGPIWHADRLLARGDTWFDVDYPAPNSFAWPLANGAGHLLVYFTPKPGATIDYADFTHQVRKGKPWYSSLPWAVYQMAGPVKFSPKQQAHFNSLLIPLRKKDKASAAARSIRVVSDEASATVLTVRKGKTTWTLALQNDGTRRQIGPVTTDGLAVVVRQRADAPPAHAIVGATFARAGSETLVQGDRPQNVERGW